MGARGDLSGSRRIDQGSSATSHGTGSDRSITSACISIDRGTHARVYSGTSSHDVRSTPTLICGSSARSHGACSAHVFGTCCRDRDLCKGSIAHNLRSTSSHYRTDRGNSGLRYSTSLTGITMVLSAEQSTSRHCKAWRHQQASLRSPQSLLGAIWWEEQ